MSRVERVIHYSELPSEAPWTAANEPICDAIASSTEATLSHKLVSPPRQWPTAGSVLFDGVVMRYRETLDPVLKGVTFSAQPGQKIGIVGRTGAGKSSIMLCLFRIEEIEAGRIVIDGVDIASLGLHRLRRSISIIPQCPVLFAGTFRSNLCPEFDDATGSDVSVDLID